MRESDCLVRGLHEEQDLVDYNTHIQSQMKKLSIITTTSSPGQYLMNFIHIFKKRLCRQKAAWAGSAREV